MEREKCVGFGAHPSPWQVESICRRRGRRRRHHCHRSGIMKEKTWGTYGQGYLGFLKFSLEFEVELESGWKLE